VKRRIMAILIIMIFLAGILIIVAIIGFFLGILNAPVAEGHFKIENNHIKGDPITSFSYAEIKRIAGLSPAETKKLPESKITEFMEHANSLGLLADTFEYKQNFSFRASSGEIINEDPEIFKNTLNPLFASPEQARSLNVIFQTLDTATRKILPVYYEICLHKFEKALESYYPEYYAEIFDKNMIR